MKGMFEQVSAQLDELLDQLDIPTSPEALIWMLGFADRLSARAMTAVGDFDASEAWRDDGATSMTAWVRQEGRASRRDASRLVSSARRLRDLPITAAAHREGALSNGQLQAIVVNLNDAITASFAVAEADMVPVLVPLPVPDVARVMQAWAQAAKDDLDDDDDRPDDSTAIPERSLHLSETLDGRGELSGSLDAEGRAIVECALRIAASDDVEGEPTRSPAHRRADALVDICRSFLDHLTTDPGSRHRPHLNVFLNYEDLIATGHAKPKGGWLADGAVLDGPTIQRLACDAGIHRIVTAGRSSILDYGHQHQHIPANLFNALVARDRGCRFPGCDRPPKWTEGHHIHHWSHHGPTKVANLVLLCSRHHHLFHLPGWHIKLLPDATVEVTRPDGRVLTGLPPGHLDRLFVTDTG